MTKKKTKYRSGLESALADALTKLWEKSDGRDILTTFLADGLTRITYCDGSWRKELAQSRAGEIRELRITDPSAWNPAHDGSTDTRTAKLGT